MSDHRLQRWPNAKPAMGQLVGSLGQVCLIGLCRLPCQTVFIHVIGQVSAYAGRPVGLL